MLSIIISTTGILGVLFGARAVLEPSLGRPVASTLAVVVLVLGAAILNKVLAKG
jgi:hypothetical protein